MEPTPSKLAFEALKPIPSPPGALFKEFRIAFLPFLLFALVAGLTLQVWRGYVGPSSLMGEVESVKSVIASMNAGRLAQVQVDALQRVLAGDPVAQVLPVDPRILDSQIALSKARIDLIRVGLGTDLRKANNRVNFESLRLDLMSKRVELMSSRSKLFYGELELSRIERLTAVTVPGSTGTPIPIFSLSERDAARRTVAVLTAESQELTKLVSEIETAISEMSVGESKVDGEVPAATRASIAVEERTLDLLEAQMGPQTLVAPFDGVVSLILRHAGETVQPGEAILNISKEKSSRVVAFLRQPILTEVRVGMKVQVRSRSGRRAVGIGEVISLGSQLEPISASMLPKSSAASGAELGLPLLVTLPNDLAVYPGELVDLELLR
ncbi:MAG: HlyD family efflux transporter periplasmic adaptor subunit [Pedosphaera sp.]|nr:HlyD family efflux transporter periplasmic adaptor subunit [Pedosphaera sp.]